MPRTVSEQTKQKAPARQAYTPLAARVRPTSLDQYIGQEKVLGTGTALRRAIEQGSVGSLILWGPPGVGKTTLAHIIAAAMDAKVERVSAVTAGVRDLRKIIDEAAARRNAVPAQRSLSVVEPAGLSSVALAKDESLLQAGRKADINTVLIVDEIHRFNKAQQDVLLPVVEEGLITLIGATTENPYFEVVAALVSRAEVVRLEPLTDEDIGRIIDQALKDKEHGIANQLKFGKDSRTTIITLAGGDARRALNILERAALAATSKTITKNQVEQAAQAKVVQYDKAGDAHYDTISAFIKSLRGSDPDAALFYLFRMLVAGEDPKFIVRRMFIFASEDIGNADPHALMLVAAASQALQWVGLPEAEYNLAHAATYLAAAPKSNAVTRAMGAAKQDVEQHGNAQPPGHITNAPIEGMKQHGKGVGYKYPHDYDGALVKQQYRPDAIQKNIYYEPGSEGFEKEVKRRIDAARAVLQGK